MPCHLQPMGTRHMPVLATLRSVSPCLAAPPRHYRDAVPQRTRGDLSRIDHYPRRLCADAGQTAPRELGEQGGALSIASSRPQTVEASRQVARGERPLARRMMLADGRGAASILNDRREA